MKINDEFRPLPPEDNIPREERALPNEYILSREIAYRKVEENDSEEVLALKRAREEKQTKQNSKSHKRLTQLLIGVVAGTTVMTGAATTDIEPEAKHYAFEITGNAALVDAHTIRLSDLNRQRVGTLVSSEQIDISEDVVIEFDILQGKNEFGTFEDGADGVSLGFTNKEQPEYVLPGGSLGYYGKFGAEFDLCTNDEATALGGTDYYQDHYAIIGESTWNHLAVSGEESLDTGKWKHVSLALSDGKMSLTYGDKDTIKAEIPADSAEEQMYLFFSGATGDGTCYQYVSNIEINGSEITVINDSGDVIGGFDPTLSKKENAKEKATKYKFVNKESSDKAISYSPIANEQLFREFLLEKAPELLTDEYLYDLDNNREIFEQLLCSECHGTGVICPGDLSDELAGCQGLNITVCSYCDDNGRDENGNLCSVCGGTRMYSCEYLEEHKTCEKCDGTGLK